MGCGCAKRPMLGRRVKAASPALAAAVAEPEEPAVGYWTTTCEGAQPMRSLLAAQSAARKCGGKVIPV